jgi:hypothetical protein
MNDANNGKDENTEKRSNDSWRKILCAIALLIVALLALPPFPPWFGTVVAALAVMIALWLFGIFPAPPPNWQRPLAYLRERPLRWNRSWVWAAILTVVFLFAIPPLPPHLRFTAVVIAALVLIAALGWLPELRATLRRWLGGPES